MAESLKQTILPTTALPLHRILHILLTNYINTYVCIHISLRPYYIIHVFLTNYIHNCIRIYMINNKINN